MLQQVDPSDGVTLIGEPQQILDRGPADGPLIEAPNLIRIDDDFILFFSSNCWSSDQYDISYATSTNLKGPYTRAERPLLVTGNYGLRSPGGASVGANNSQSTFSYAGPVLVELYNTDWSLRRAIETTQIYCSMLVVIAASSSKKQGAVCMKRPFPMTTELSLSLDNYRAVKNLPFYSFTYIASFEFFKSSQANI